MERAHEKLARYAQIDTMSQEGVEEFPSTKGQLVLAKMLKKEMEEIGLTEITLDDNGYLFGTLPANTEKDVPVIGLIAHMDTSPDFPGKANPRILTYEGADIVLNAERTITPERFPILNDLIGEEIMVTDGTSLLGGDDKAGIAAILSAMEYLTEHQEIKHGKIRIGFTPDEEIGRGAHRFDVPGFGAEFAYTIDSGEIGTMQYESFNAASATVHIHGESIHPGSAKNRMINASLLGMELFRMLPEGERPEYTEGEEGFYLLLDFKGNVEKADMSFIIRDHDRKIFEKRKELFQKAVAFLNHKYDNRIECTIKDTYYNMGDVIKEHMELVDYAAEAMKRKGITPVIGPTRGGTDGSQLSFMGLPTPNIFTGTVNHHGPYEIAVLSWMDKLVEVIGELCAIFEEKAES